MIDDFKKSCQLIFHERITSPFSGAFFFSWVVWNWRLPYFLFFANDGLKLNERLSFIDSNFINMNRNLWLPLVSAVFLVTLYPIVTTVSLWIWLKYKKIQSDLKNKIEGQTLLTFDQSIAIRQEMKKHLDDIGQVLSARDEELKRKDVDIQKLKTELGDLRVDATKRQSPKPHDLADIDKEYLNSENDKKGLMDREVKILNLFVSQESLSNQDLAFQSGLQQVEADYYAEKLIQAGYLSKNVGRFRLTQRGRKFLVNQ